jgi:hypothetical protein
MIRTAMLSLLGLGLAAGIPFAYYAFTESDDPLSISKLTGVAAKTKAKAKANADSSGDKPAATAKKESARSAYDDPPIRPMDEVLRFDINPDWVISGWPRVMTGLGQIQLKGYRVPLVTGTAEDDLAGSLTYYFDPYAQLQRIVFHGTTGNPQRLIALVTNRFGFARHVVNHPGLVLYEVPPAAGETPRSTLSVESAAVIKASDPYQRFRLTMVIERPLR